MRKKFCAALPARRGSQEESTRGRTSRDTGPTSRFLRVSTVGYEVIGMSAARRADSVGVSGAGARFHEMWHMRGESEFLCTQARPRACTRVYGIHAAADTPAKVPRDRTQMQYFNYRTGSPIRGREENVARMRVRGEERFCMTP